MVAFGLPIGYVVFYRDTDFRLPWDSSVAAGKVDTQIPSTPITIGMTAKDVCGLHTGLVIDKTPTGTVPLFRFGRQRPHPLVHRAGPVGYRLPDPPRIGRHVGQAGPAFGGDRHS